MREYESVLETKEFRLKNIIVHEKYEKRADLEKRTFIWHNDIALLELEEEVDLSVYTPVCLPSSVRNRDNTPALAIGKVDLTLWNCAKLNPPVYGISTYIS